MNEKNNLITGSVGKVMMRFVLPYLLSCFMQTFYGMADLFVVGQFHSSEVTTAVPLLIWPVSIFRRRSTPWDGQHLWVRFCQR